MGFKHEVIWQCALSFNCKWLIIKSKKQNKIRIIITMNALYVNNNSILHVDPWIGGAWGRHSTAAWLLGDPHTVSTYLSEPVACMGCSKIMFSEIELVNEISPHAIHNSSNTGGIKKLWCNNLVTSTFRFRFRCFGIAHGLETGRMHKSSPLCRTELALLPLEPFNLILI